MVGAELSSMNINLTPEQERIVNDELKSGHFRSAEEVIAQALMALREKERLSVAGGGNGSHAAAVREMLNFVEENRTPLQDISVKRLILDSIVSGAANAFLTLRVGMAPTQSQSKSKATAADRSVRPTRPT